MTNLYKKINNYFPIICLLLIYLLFNLLLINKFFPVTEGWFQDYARYILNGFVPYRDFYCPVPIGALSITTVLCKIFGSQFIVLRYYGVIERLVFIAIVFLLVKRVYNEKITFISLLTAAIIYISNVQDVFFSYYQSALLFAFVGLLFCIKMLEKPNNMCKYAFWFGISSGISFLMKQNVGSLFAIVVGICVACFLYKEHKRDVIYSGFIAFFSANFIIAGVGLYLYFNDALFPFLNQIFSGASSKGSLVSIFFSVFLRVSLKQTWLLLFGLTFWLVLGKYLLIIRHKYSNNPRTDFLFINLTLLFFVIPICFICYYFSLINMFHTFWNLPHKKFIIAFIFTFSEIIMYLSYEFLRNDLNKYFYYLVNAVFFSSMFILVSKYSWLALDFMQIRNHRQIFIYALFYGIIIWMISLGRKIRKENLLIDKIKFLLILSAWTNMYIHGMSAVIEDHGTILLFSIFFSTMLTYKTYCTFFKNLCVVFFCLGNIFAVDVQRCTLPYHWWGVGASPSIYLSKYKYSDPNLRGYYGEKKMVDTMNSIYEIIKRNKHEGDTCYSFPHINYFNVMSELPSPTFAKVNYFDVCPDNVASFDAKMLLNNPPTFIIWQDLSEDVWRIHEQLFRNGKRSGQRDIQDVVKGKIAQGKYIMLGKFILYQSDPVFIYGLNDGRKWLK